MNELRFLLGRECPVRIPENAAVKLADPGIFTFFTGKWGAATQCFELVEQPVPVPGAFLDIPHCYQFLHVGRKANLAPFGTSFQVVIVIGRAYLSLFFLCPLSDLE